MQTTKLARTLDAVLSVLSGPGLLRTRLTRAWCLYLVDLDPELLPVTHRARLLSLRGRMAATERAPLTVEEATRWSDWLTSLALEHRGARAVTSRPTSTRPTVRPPSLLPHARV